MNFDLKDPIDSKQAIQCLSGNAKMFYSMLSKMEGMSINANMKQISDGLETENWAKMKNGAHSLKGSSSYVGAGYLYYACLYMMLAYGEENYVDMARYYPLLVEAVIEFKRFSRRLFAE